MIEAMTEILAFRGLTKMNAIYFKAVFIGAIAFFVFLKMLPFIFLTPIPLALYFDFRRTTLLPHFRKKIAIQAAIFVAFIVCFLVYLSNNSFRGTPNTKMLMVWKISLVYLLVFVLYTNMNFRRKLSEAKNCLGRFFISRHVSSAQKRLRSLEKKYGKQSDEYIRSFEAELEKIMKEIKNHKKNIKFFKKLKESELSILFERYRVFVGKYLGEKA